MEVLPPVIIRIAVASAYTLVTQQIIGAQNSAAVIENVRVEAVLDANTIRLTWDPAAVLQEGIWDDYLIYYTTISKKTGRVVNEQTLKSNGPSAIVPLTHVHPKFENRFQVVVHFEVDREEFDGERSIPVNFNFGTMDQFSDTLLSSYMPFFVDAGHFQLHLSPVDNCASWGVCESGIVFTIVVAVLCYIFQEGSS